MKNLAAWCYLALAIVTEVAGITAMKLSDAFSNLKASVFIFIFYGLSLFFLAFSLRRLEIGLAYAIWSALGTLLIFIIGVLFFQEHFTQLKALSVLFIIVGVIGLKHA
jgi:small multidrug resistance pump